MRIELGERDHYRVLGVPRDASMHEIRRAYRRLARQHHPDISPQPRDGEYFTVLTTAYEVLHDPNKRARYDHDQPGPVAVPLADLAGSVRHRTGWVESDPVAASPRDASGLVPGRDRRANLELSVREAAQLADRAIIVQAGGYTIRLPAGLRAGQQIRLVGAGEPGWRGGPPGDLLLTLDTPFSSLTAAGAGVLDLFLALAAASTTSILFSGRGFTWQ